jgi:hypothetical protein
MTRIQTKAAASILGVTPRTVQNLANRGELPGAAKIGKVWTFDPAKLQRFIADQEEFAQARALVPKAIPPRKCEPPLRASESERRYEEAMSRMLGKPLASIKRRKPPQSI